MEVIYKKTVVDELKKVLLNADCRNQKVEKIIINKEELNELQDDILRQGCVFGVKNLISEYGNGKVTFLFKSLHGLTKKATFAFEVQ